MNSFSTNNSRIAWIDWMKVIGMYFIILGHFFPYGYEYIYVFNVPVFFVISGYLCKKEKAQIVFWRKIIQKYIIPLIFIVIAMYLWNWHTWEQNDKASKTLYFLYFSFIGSQKCLGTGWFIYTLIILRIIFQYSPSSTLSHICLFCVFSLLSIFLHFHNIHHFNAVLNAATAYPVFLMGHFFYIQTENNSHTYKTDIKILLLLVTIICIYICGKINGEVWMYNNDYGKSFILFLLGSITGSVLLYILSIMLEKNFKSIIHTLSAGNILTLGFHPIVIAAIGRHGGYIDYVTSFFILISFFPIIQLTRMYFPYILGIRKFNKI